MHSDTESSDRRSPAKPFVTAIFAQYKHSLETPTALSLMTWASCLRRKTVGGLSVTHLSVHQRHKTKDAEFPEIGKLFVPEKGSATGQPIERTQLTEGFDLNLSGRSISSLSMGIRIASAIWWTLLRASLAGRMEALRRNSLMFSMTGLTTFSTTGAMRFSRLMSGFDSSSASGCTW